MKKIIIAFLLFTQLLPEKGFGQAFDKGRVVISAGYGVPNLIILPFRVVYKIADYTNVSFSGFGPLLFKAEYGLSQKIGLGLTGGYSTMSVGYTYKDWDIYQNQKIDYHAKLTWSSPSVGARFNFHFATEEKLDPYFGFGLGWTGHKFRYSDDSPWSDHYPSPGFGGLYFTMGIGLRYYFTDNIGFYTELGWDKTSLLQAGIVAKF